MWLSHPSRKGSLRDDGIGSKMCYGRFVLVIKISAIRILARRRRVNFGFRVSDLPALEVSFLESANGGSAVASAKADFEFFTEIRNSISFKSLL